MEMHGNFDARLTLKNGGRTVTASGWIRWDEIEPEVQTVRIYATVAQDEETADERCATGSGAQPYTRPGDNGLQTWRFDITEDEARAFKPGVVRGGGVLISTNPGWVYPWGADCSV
jgi:hypothetical protein